MIIGSFAYNTPDGAPVELLPLIVSQAVMTKTNTEAKAKDVKIPLICSRRGDKASSALRFQHYMAYGRGSVLSNGIVSGMTYDGVTLSNKGREALKKSSTQGTTGYDLRPKCGQEEIGLG